MKKFTFQIAAVCAILLSGLMSCKKNSDEPTSSFFLDASNLQGTIADGTVVLKSGSTYYLTGPLNVAEGATLKVECGVNVVARTANGASNLFINILRGGKIMAEGTASCPITFTSDSNIRGGWGGICIHGRASNNVGENAASEINGVQYGGTDSMDNSGILKYIIIRNSGAINGAREFNGLSMFSVGAGTTLSHVAIINGNDDAFEWYGGTVNGSFLYASNNDDDNFDYDLGYRGRLENLYSINTNANASSDSRGIEADGNPDNNLATPFTNPVLTNVTLIGRGATFTGTQREGIYLRRGVKGTINNVYVKGYKTGVGVEHAATFAAVGTALKVNTIQFEDVTNKTLGTPNTQNVSAVITEGTATGAGSTSATKPSWATWF